MKATDPKTTIAGILTGIFTLLAYFNYIVPEVLTIPILAAGVGIIAYLARDKAPMP